MNLFIRRKAYNFLDRYDILDDSGRLAYTVDGFLVRFGGHLTMRDRAGANLLTLRKKTNLFFSNYTVEPCRNSGFQSAVMSQKFSMNPRFEIDYNKDALVLSGNLRASSFALTKDTDIYARIRKRVMRWGDTYILSVSNIQDAPVYSALTVALDNALYLRR